MKYVVWFAIIATGSLGCSWLGPHLAERWLRRRITFTQNDAEFWIRHRGSVTYSLAFISPVLVIVGGLAARVLTWT